MYRVRLTKRAAKFYKSTDAALARRLARAFAVLESTPRQYPNIKALKGKLAGQYRYRIGDYRIVYRIQDEEIEVIILLVAHRSEVYDA
ncbi:MAG: type II toxin-antitoxin system RelE/ParE family toxin [Cyanobacteria bacterium P01_D01_bin.115]